MNQIGRYFQEFRIGEIIEHKVSKTIFESDNNFFCLLTMNHHPVHLNIDYASNSHHGKILVVGTLVFSLVVGITVPDISGRAIANLEYESIKHIGPVFINDTLYAYSKILDLISSTSKPDRGIVYVKTYAKNQHGEKVIEFKRKVLIKKYD
jgi:acyl dehydratase